MQIIDAHSDVLYQRAFDPGFPMAVSQEQMQTGGISLQVCTLFAGNGRDGVDPFDKAQAQLAVWRGWCAQGMRALEDPGQTVAGVVSGMLSIEGGEIFGQELARVRCFRDAGVRMVALIWNNENAIASPAKGGSTQGIKPFGWRVLQEMADVGMAADVSHLNERGFFDLMARHVQPPLASHSCAHALCPHPRNLTDTQIRALIERGGWIGINFYPPFLRQDGRACIDDIVAHIDYIAQMGGSRHVGFGADFGVLDEVPDGAGDPTCYPVILEALRAKGYGEEALQDIAGRNFQRYYERLSIS